MKKFQYLGTLQFLTQYCFPMRIHTMYLKYVLGQIQPNRCHLHLGRSFHWARKLPLSWHLQALLKEGVHSIRT